MSGAEKARGTKEMCSGKVWRPRKYNGLAHLLELEIYCQKDHGRCGARRNGHYVKLGEGASFCAWQGQESCPSDKGETTPNLRA